jgi:CRISPR-associated protein Cmr2
VRAARDVGEIAAGSRRYIGMIYADGNNVARYMGTCETLLQYQQRAKKLSDAAQGAVFAALAQHLRPMRVGEEWVHPFEILTIGGDDLLVLVPGDKALAIAASIGYMFEELMGAKVARTLAERYHTNAELSPDFRQLTPEVGLSAGVVIAQENAPIFFADR